MKYIYIKEVIHKNNDHICTFDFNTSGLFGLVPVRKFSSTDVSGIGR